MRTWSQTQRIAQHRYLVRLLCRSTSMTQAAERARRNRTDFYQLVCGKAGLKVGGSWRRTLPGKSPPYKDYMLRVKRAYLSSLMRRSQWNVATAAAWARTNRTHLYKLLEAAGVSLPQKPDATPVLTGLAIGLGYNWLRATKRRRNNGPQRRAC